MRVEPVFKGHAWVALLLFVMLLMDGFVVTVFGQWIMTDNFIGTPQLTLMTLIMITVWLPDERYIVLMAAATGLVADSFYTGILGVKVLIWPLLIYFVREVAPSVPHSAFFVLALAIVAMTAALIADFILMRLAGLANSSLIDLIGWHLGPALVVNLVLFPIAYLPIRQILLKLEP